MPPKVTESRPSAEALHAVEEETAAAARRIVATYAEGLVDGVTLMCMLGVEPEGVVHKRIAEKYAEPEPPKKSTRKTTAKKTTAKKSTAKKAPAKKSTAKKSTAKKTSARKTTAKKSTAKKTTAKKTTARKTTARKDS